MCSKEETVAVSGKTIQVLAYGYGHQTFREVYSKVGEVCEHPSGAVSIYDIGGRSIITYGPNGYQSYKEVNDADLRI